MPNERSPQTEDKYIVRFPEGMRDQLKAEAKRNNRTLNAEIVARLEGSLNPQAEQNTAQEDLQSALKAQVMVSNAGLQLTSAAVRLLALELPDAINAKAFSIIKETLAAGIKAVPADADPLTDEAFDAVSTAVESLEATVRKLRALKLAHSLKPALKNPSDR